MKARCLMMDTILIMLILGLILGAFLLGLKRMYMYGINKEIALKEVEKSLNTLGYSKEEREQRINYARLNYYEKDGTIDPMLFNIVKSDQFTI